MRGCSTHLTDSTGGARHTGSGTLVVAVCVRVTSDQRRSANAAENIHPHSTHLPTSCRSKAYLGKFGAPSASAFLCSSLVTPPRCRRPRGFNGESAARGEWQVASEPKIS
jgi:hypothetical protein